MERLRLPFLSPSPSLTRSLLSHYKYRDRDRDRERERSHPSQHIRLLLERLRASATFPFSQRIAKRKKLSQVSYSTKERGREISSRWPSPRFAEWRSKNQPSVSYYSSARSVRFVYSFFLKLIPRNKKRNDDPIGRMALAFPTFRAGRWRNILHHSIHSSSTGFLFPDSLPL